MTKCRLLLQKLTGHISEVSYQILVWCGFSMDPTCVPISKEISREWGIFLLIWYGMTHMLYSANVNFAFCRCKAMLRSPSHSWRSGCLHWNQQSIICQPKWMDPWFNGPTMPTLQLKPLDIMPSPATLSPPTTLPSLATLPSMATLPPLVTLPSSATVHQLNCQSIQCQLKQCLQ